MTSGRGFFQVGAATAALASALIFAAPRAAVAQSDVSKTAEEEAAHAADYERDYVKALRLYDAALSAARAKDASGEGPDVARLTAARTRVPAPPRGWRPARGPSSMPCSSASAGGGRRSGPIWR